VRGGGGGWLLEKGRGETPRFERGERRTRESLATGPPWGLSIGHRSRCPARDGSQNEKASLRRGSEMKNMCSQNPSRLMIRPIIGKELARYIDRDSSNPLYLLISVRRWRSNERTELESGNENLRKVGWCHGTA